MGKSLRRRATALLGLGVLLASAACGGGRETPEVGTGSETAGTPASSGEPAAPAPDAGDNDADDEDADDAPADDTSADEPSGGAEAFRNGTSAAAREPGAAGLLTVTDVRVGRHDRFDRVVFDLDGEGTPGWNVEYVDEAHDDGSGELVDVDGDAILSVRISGTAMPTDSGVEEYDGTTVDPDDDPDEESVEEVVYRFWFEGYTTAFIGVDGDPSPFRVFALEDPARVVVDVQH